MLPSVDQLGPTRLLPGVDLGADDTGAHWISEVSQSDTSAGNSAGVSALTVRDNGGVAPIATPFSPGSEHPYRCVFSLVR